jgi:hypothetical protein
MNTQDPNLEGWVGRNVIDGVSGPSGIYDLTNASVVGNLAAKITGVGLRKAAPTPELLAKGKAAKPVYTEQEKSILRSINENNIPEQVQPPGRSQAQDIPVGASRKDAGGAIDNTASAPGEAAGDADKAGEFTEALSENQLKELEKRTWRRNINLEYITNAEQLGPVLETVADQIPEASRRSFAEVRGKVDSSGHMEIMKDVLKDTSNPQALTDVQLLAGREVLLGLTEELNDVATKISLNRGTPEDYLKFDKLSDQSVMLQRFMQGSIRETARALNSLKIVAQTINSGNAEQIANMAKTGNHVTRAQQIVDMNKAGASAADIVDESYKMGKIRGLTAALVNLRNASILTGFRTQAVNMVSNSFYTTLDTLMVKPIQVGIGVARQYAGKGSAERAYLGEVGGELAAFRNGMRDAILMGTKTWWYGTFKNRGEYISSFGGRKIDEVEGDAPLIGDAIKDIAPVTKYTGIPQVANAWQRVNESVSYGLLTASDEFYKAMAYRKSLYGQAVRQAYMEDIPRSQIPDRVDELLNNVTKEMHDQGIADAERLTFTNRAGSRLLNLFADALVKGGQIFPPLKIIVPFVRTPTALFDRTIRFSPLAAIQSEFRERVKKGGVEGDQALAEMTTGTALLGMFMVMYANGDITGDGPGYGSGKTDMRKVWEKTGWQGASVKLPTGQYMSLERGFDPVTMPILAVASYLDKMYTERYEPDAEEIAIGSIFALAKHFKDNTYMQGVSDLMAVIDGRKNWTQYAASQTAGFVPALARDVADISRGIAGDPTTPRVPASNNFWDLLRQQVSNRIPGAEPQMIQRYWDGSPAVPGGGEMLSLYNSVSPVRLRNIQGKKGRAVDESNNELYINGVNPAEPDPVVSLEYGGARTSGIQVNLVNDLNNGAELYDKLLQFVGKRRRQYVDALVKSKDYENIEGEKGPGSWHSVALDRALAKGMQDGKKEFVSWLADQDLSVERYGERVQLLDSNILKSLLKGMQKGTATEEDVDVMSKAGLRGVPTREQRQPPQYMPNI